MLNKVTLLGNLGADAELFVGQNGSSVTKFRLATTEKFKDKEGNLQERTSWHRCVLFGKRGDSLAKYLTKGSRLYLEGRLEYGEYEKEGVRHFTTDIVVQDVKLLGGNNTKPREAPPAEENNASWDNPTETTEIPF